MILLADRQLLGQGNVVVCSVLQWDCIILLPDSDSN